MAMIEPVAWIGETLMGRQYINGQKDELIVGTPLYTHPAELTDEDLDKLITDAEQDGYMEMYIVGLIDGFNRARAILRKAQ